MQWKRRRSKSEDEAQANYSECQTIPEIDVEDILQQDGIDCSRQDNNNQHYLLHMGGCLELVKMRKASDRG